MFKHYQKMYTFGHIKENDLYSNSDRDFYSFNTQISVI